MNDLRHAPVDRKVVAVRVDLNVPTDGGRITDDTRIVAALPTINHLRRSGAKVLLISHFGRPKGRPDPSMSLEPVARALEGHLDDPVAFASDCIGPAVEETVAAIDYGEVALLENVRFHAGETSNDLDFARSLAEPAEIFVNDAFGAAHRSHASVVGLARLLPSYPGFLLASEIAALEKVLNNPDRPLAALVGGAKISSKIGVLRNLLEKVDMLLLGGGMANTFLAANGLDMQASLVEAGHLVDATDIQKKARETGCEIVLPTDGVMASGLVAGAETAVRAVDKVPDGWTMLDIGPNTERQFADRLTRAGTIVWNGPMGMFEDRRFARGTEQVAREVAASGAFSMIGGGDSVAAVKLLGIESKFDHISTGGGASLEMLEGKTLPGIAALG